MVAPGNVNPKGGQAPAPAGQGRPMKSAGDAGWQQPGSDVPHHPPGDVRQTKDVIHQKKRLTFSPPKAALCGFAFVTSLAYLTLYSKKKPEATALDVAKVTSGTATPENTRPRN